MMTFEFLGFSTVQTVAAMYADGCDPFPPIWPSPWYPQPVDY